MLRKIALVLFLLAPLGFYPFLRDNGPQFRDGEDDNGSKHSSKSTTTAAKIPVETLTALQCLAAFPGQPFPGNLPWEPMRRVTDEDPNSPRNTALRLFASASSPSFPGNVPWEP